MCRYLSEIRHHVRVAEDCRGRRAGGPAREEQKGRGIGREVDGTDLGDRVTWRGFETHEGIEPERDRGVRLRGRRIGKRNSRTGDAELARFLGCGAVRIERHHHEPGRQRPERADDERRVVGFLDKKDEFKEYKLVRIKSDQLKITTINNYRVGSYRTVVK